MSDSERDDELENALLAGHEDEDEAAPDTGAPVAYLRQYMYIVVREPEKDYREGTRTVG